VKTYRQVQLRPCPPDLPHAFARCVWKRAAWVDGDGPYALLAHCRVLTLTLRPAEAEAEASKRIFDLDACEGSATTTTKSFGFSDEPGPQPSEQGRWIRSTGR